MKPVPRLLDRFVLIFLGLILFGLLSYPGPTRADFIGTDLRYVFADDLVESSFGAIAFSDAQQIDLSYGNIVDPLQAEYELWLRRQNMDTFTDASGNTFSASGRMYTFGVRLNLTERVTYWEWTGGWVPYWGFGLGAHFDWVNDAELGPTRRLDGTSIGVGAIWLVGVDYPIRKTMNLGLDTRFFWAQGPSFTETSGNQDIDFGSRFDPSLALRLHWRF